MADWDRRMLELARYVADWSKDPSTKVGAVITDANEHKKIISVGYNGFPSGIVDTPERLANRALKYRLTVHAELNAAITAARSLNGCTLYTWPLGCCTQCAMAMIQYGITRVVYPSIPSELAERWSEDIELALAMFKEAFVYTQEITL